MADPWAAFRTGAPAAQPAQQTNPQGDPIIKRADPYKPAEEARAADDQAIQREQLRLAQRREAREAAAEAAKNAPPKLSPEQQLSIRQEARQKIGLIDSLKRRSRDGWFATGFGANVVAGIPGTTASDVAKDVQTVSAAGALQRIMEMAATNGGKNPLTPLSNADFVALGQSIANLDPTQSDEQFQRNLDVYRDIYMRAFKSAGGTTNRVPRDGSRRTTQSAAPQSGWGKARVVD